MKPLLVSAHNPMTGPRHLGHYASTMIDWPEQQKNHQIVIVIDDLISTLLYPQSRKEITNRSFQVASEFIATGIDLEQNSIVLTSMLPEALEFAFFAGQALDQSWCYQLYEESFAGILSSYQRRELGLPNRPSVSEVTYPQLHLASLTLGMGADYFQGGEEMRGYLGIMETIVHGLGQLVKMPNFLAGRTTFLIGTDERHMASENAIYLSESAENIAQGLSKIRSIETLHHLAESIGGREFTKNLPREKDSLDECCKSVNSLLVKDLAKFRDRKISNEQIAEVLDASAIRVREQILKNLVKVKAHYGIPGFEA